MTRTFRYKLAYFGIMACTLLIFSAIFDIFSSLFHAPLARFGGFSILIAMFFVPGRVLGYYWRDLLTGLKLLRERKYVESEHYSQKFIATIRAHPWRKKLIWLGSAAYSRDPEAMALTNLGAAQIELGQFELAEGNLEDAIKADPENPLPYYNLGILHTRLERAEQARAAFDRARELGFTNSRSDRIVRASQSRFASRDGHGDTRFPANKSVEAEVGSRLAGQFVVKLINDSTTPMGFVATILQDVFGKTRTEAVRIMLSTHHSGEALCGVYHEDEARAKVAEVARRAQEEGHALMCTAKPCFAETKIALGH